MEDVPEPKITDDGDALVRISKSAICASDLHLLHGKIPGARPGSIIGHEFVGHVVDAGDASSWKEGERVVGSFLIACGSCRRCRSRDFNLCENRKLLGLGPVNGDLEGAQAELVRVPNALLNLHRLDGALAEIADDHAVFAGDVLATGFHGAELAGIREGDSVVVIGGGPVGAMCASAAKARGASQVAIADTDPERVTFARSVLGFEGIDLSVDEASAAVAGLTRGAMADAVIEAVGAVAALKTALRCVRFGGRVAVVGVYVDERIDLHLGMAWNKGITIRFSSMANVHARWDEALDSLAAGTLDPTKVVTHDLPLADAAEGYELFESRRALKVLLTP